ncbi:MAG: UbiA prenyltransferase family protein [Euryarchaeota archaeon]|nr:UbiA prenyltransferase family protein [Euryarchaeota archaeon]MDE1836581.1 UbiA prenyltransferase family protein [Euryarchaeota archaeon]MDE1879224.1 UbiA prenyltransferase family protein [Euryarchaeota archaeon]MDE2044551.1 UbiA prenyltransferase family protein [Thermoplasmata archaeon]
MPGPWLRLFRPVTLFPVLVLAVVFSLMGLGHGPDLDQWLHILLAGSLLVVANGCSNLINETSPIDMVADRTNERTKSRPVASGELDASVVQSVGVIGWLLSIVVGALFLPSIFVALDALTLTFAWVYSRPPYGKKYLGPNALNLGVPRGGLGIAAAWVVYGSFFSPGLWTVLAITVPFVTLGNTAKDIDDQAGDMAAGVETVATRWGSEVARFITLIGVVWPLVVMLMWRLYTGNPWLLLYVVPMFVAIGGAFKWKGEKLWSRGFYGTYAVLALLLGLPTLLHLLGVGSFTNILTAVEGLLRALQNPP